MTGTTWQDAETCMVGKTLAPLVLDPEMMCSNTRCLKNMQILLRSFFCRLQTNSMTVVLIPHLAFGVMPGINEPLKLCTLNL
jgi:hypothetical protein